MEFMKLLGIENHANVLCQEKTDASLSEAIGYVI